MKNLKKNQFYLKEMLVVIGLVIIGSVVGKVEKVSADGGGYCSTTQYTCSPYSDWSACSEDCGGGTQTRSRTCTYKQFGQILPKNKLHNLAQFFIPSVLAEETDDGDYNPCDSFTDTETQSCNTQLCPCEPDCSDAPNHCPDDSFDDGCGGTCQGTKDCSTVNSGSGCLIGPCVPSSSDPSCTLNFSPSSTISGDPSTASWTSSNATSAKYSCTGVMENSGGWGSIEVNGSMPFYFNVPTGIEDCTITVKNSTGKEASCSDYVNVGAASPVMPSPPSNIMPFCNAYFSSSTVTAPGDSTLYWSSSNATSATYSCTGPQVSSGSILTSMLTNGSMPFTFSNSQTGTENCTITVKDNAGQTETCSSSVNVKTNASLAPFCTLSFSPSSITAPGSSTASWTSSNATSVEYSCTGPISGSNGWGSIGPDGSMPFTFSSSQTGVENCIITVKNSAGDTAECLGSVTVNP